MQVKLITVEGFGPTVLEHLILLPSEIARILPADDWITVVTHREQVLSCRRIEFVR